MYRTISRLALCAFTASPLFSQAQAGIGTPNNRELQIFGESQVSNGNNRSIGNVGIAYKKKLFSVLSFRVAASMTNFSDWSANRLAIQGTDSIRSESIHNNAKLGSLALGIDAERKFYKRIYLASGLELRGGYGTGHVDTNVTIYQQNSQFMGGDYSTRSVRNPELLGVTLIQVRPYIGARVYFPRLTVGLEFGPNMSYTNKTIHGTSQSLSELDMGSVTGRLSLGFRL